MKKIIGIAGSVRGGSLNQALLHAAVQLAPPGTLVEVRSIRGIPLYDGDREASDGIPEEVRSLKDAITEADALLLVTPEYNNSIPGRFKNAIDWLSRPPRDRDRVFGNKPVAVIGASPGAFGTMMAQAAWLPVLRALRMRQYFGASLYVSRAHEAFDDDGRLADEAVRERLRNFLEGFAAFVG